MGVYIKGMNMPTSCRECRFDNAGWCLATDRAENRTQFIKFATYDSPQEWCPLVPVTPHGDLIDRDVLEVHDGWMNEDREWNVQQTHITFVYSNDIANAPTIIPAEEEE